MTVRELVEILEKFDQKRVLLIDGYEYGFHELEASGIEMVKFDRDVHDSYYSGPHEIKEDGRCEGVLLTRS